MTSSLAFGWQLRMMFFFCKISMMMFSLRKFYEQCIEIQLEDALQLGTDEAFAAA